MADKNSVNVELYDMPLTNRPDDRFGRVVTKSSLNEDDLINMAVSERTDLNPATLRSSMEILRNIAQRRIANGDTVAFGLAYFGLEVKGMFIGDDARWDSKRHSLSVRATPTAGLRKVIREVTVNMRGMARTGTVINTVTDVASKEVNSRLTPGDYRLRITTQFSASSYVLKEPRVYVLNHILCVG